MSKSASIKKLYGERPEHWMRNALVAAGRSNDDISEFGFGSESDFGRVSLFQTLQKTVKATQAAAPKPQFKNFADFTKQLTKKLYDNNPNVIASRTVKPAMVPDGKGGERLLTDNELVVLGQHKFTYDPVKNHWTRPVNTLGGRTPDPKQNAVIVGDLLVIPPSGIAYTSAVLQESNRKWREARKRESLPWHKKLSRGVKKAVKSVAKAVTSVPVIGPAIEVTAKAVAGSVVFPIQVAKNVAQGKRIDRAVYEPFKERVKEIQEVAPYVQSVISFVPGIGTGVAGAIGAANALMKGQPITDALIEGAKGAIPGGPVAAAAFDVGVAAMKGKPVDEVVMQAIPLPAEQKKLIISGAKSVKDIANGKNVAESLYNNAKGYLPKEAQAAFDAGIAIAQGQNLQKITAAVTPKLAPALTGIGEQRIQNSPVLRAGLKVLTPANAQGYKVGLGFMAHKVNPTALISLRRSLPPQEKKGFDIAVSTHVGSVRAPLKDKKMSPAERFGFYATQGLQGGKPSLNASMMKTIIKDPETRKGAGKAATKIKKQRNLSRKERGFWAWVNRTIKKIKTEVKELV